MKHWTEAFRDWVKIPTIKQCRKCYLTFQVKSIEEHEARCQGRSFPYE